MDPRFLLFLVAFVADASTLMYSAKDPKQMHSHEEVDLYNYYYHQLDNRKHAEHKSPNHKYHGHKPPEYKYYEYKQPEQKQQEHKQHEYKHPEHKPQQQQEMQMQIYKPQQSDHHHHHHHYHGYEHKHHHEHKYPDHNHKPQGDHHKHHDYNHKHQDHDHKHDHHHHEHKGQPHYEFKYGVRDPSTGDIKNQWEVRKGDDVLGEYSLVEADGTIRTVQYTAGKHTGFNAIVKKEGKSKHPIGTGSTLQKNPGPLPSAKHTYQVPGSNAKPKLSAPVYEPRQKSGPYAEANSPRVHYLVPSQLPINHKPVFTGVDEESNLLALYRHHPVQPAYNYEEQPFDYGIGEYLSKRSYDLSKISKFLNPTPRPFSLGGEIDPLRAVRGGFVMGR